MKFYLIFMVAMGLSACSQSVTPTDSQVNPTTQNSKTSENTSTAAKTETSSASSTAASTTTASEDDDGWDSHQTPVDPKDMLAPMEAIKNLDKRIEEYTLGANLSAEQIEKNRQLKRDLIRGTFDIKELCRLALAKHWDEIGEPKQRQFVKLMVNLLEKKAVFSKDQLRGEEKVYRIQYLKEKMDDAEKTKATVTTKMFVPRDKMDLDLTYKMTKTPSGWKIFDVIVDDASLLLNYKTQFHNIIEKSGIDELIKRMEGKLKELK